MAATTQPFRLRPGTWADIPRTAMLYTLAFGNDTLLQILFPEREKHPEEYVASIERLLQMRFWTLGWRFTVAVDENDVPQAFSWWNRGKGNESFWRRWLSPTWWFAPVVRLWLRLRNRLFPFRLKMNNAFAQVVHHESEKFLNTPRRRSAHYLSLLGVRPDLQGTGLGSLLLRDGLRDVDGLRDYYERFGFKDVGTVAVGELAIWDGGYVMFRE
ncbi:hypothetical protein NLU13_5557 [Sarocladium strictum]|uniref:N-acetyltransferase domain-containing protein n=1 Tax=Sarocladium strictum TaxID=5046 RepID=A0AA39L811_SARSR|nr:hypothetical protein NLU13_5557 [Sarocladium strictum]